MTLDIGAVLRERLSLLEKAEGARPLAKRLGLPFGIIRSALDGRDLKVSSIQRIAAALGMDLSVGPHLDAIPPADPLVIDEAEYDHLPLYGAVDAAAGAGAVPIEETATGSVAFRSAWLRSRKLSPKSAIMIQVRGDSMERAIYDRHLILVDTRAVAKRIVSGDIYVIRQDDGLYVKRVYQQRRGLILSSDNPAYEPIFIPRSDAADASVVGHVVWSGGDVPKALP